METPPLICFIDFAEDQGLDFFLGTVIYQQTICCTELDEFHKQATSRTHLDHVIDMANRGAWKPKPAVRKIDVAKFCTDQRCNADQTKAIIYICQFNSLHDMDFSHATQLLGRARTILSPPHQETVGGQ